MRRFPSGSLPSATFSITASVLFVLAGLDPVISAPFAAEPVETWMAGLSPAMTRGDGAPPSVLARADEVIE